MKIKMKNLWLPLIISLMTISCIHVMLRGKHDLSFSHNRHTVGEEMDCADCHKDIGDSEKVSDNNLPNHETCSDCHEKELDETNSKCNHCHTDEEILRKTSLTENSTEAKSSENLDNETVSLLKFSHKKHLDNEDKKITCEDCHKTVKEAKKWEPHTMPGHDQCITCHEKEYDMGNCLSCHEKDVLQNTKPMLNFSHKGNFLKNHSMLAKTQNELCSSCHDESFCLDCHSKEPGIKPSIKHIERMDRNIIHRGDYISRHNIEANINPASCLKCHGERFCSDCHKKYGMFEKPGISASDSSISYNPHPSNYKNKSYHGADAKRNIVRCITCHDDSEKSECLNCHKFAAKPHKGGLSTSDMNSKAPCTFCHK